MEGGSLTAELALCRHVTSVLLWYSGPSPPDENLVTHAYILATILPRAAGFTNMRTKNTAVSMSNVATGQPRKLLSPKNRLVIKIVATIAIIVGVGLVIAAGTGAVLYTVHEDLRYASGTFSQGGWYAFSQGGWYAPSLNNSRGDRTASIEMLFPSGVLQANTTIPMKVSVWHTDTTHLDSFDLTLSTAPTSALWVWLNPSSGGNPMQITKSGVYGSGTVVYDLLVQPIPFPTYSNYPLNFDAQITLHDNSYLFVQHAYSAEVMNQFQIAPNGTVTG